LPVRCPPSARCSYSNVYLEMPTDAMLRYYSQYALTLTQVVSNVVRVCLSVRQQGSHGGQALLGRELLKWRQFDVARVNTLALHELSRLLRSNTEELRERTDAKLACRNVKRLDMPRQTLAVHHGVQTFDLPLQ